MARMAMSGADLFRTIGGLNARVRQMVEDLAPGPEEIAAASANAALAPAALLPPEQCGQTALNARFGKAADAQGWIESQIGKAPKKVTWLMIEQTHLRSEFGLNPLFKRSQKHWDGFNQLELLVSGAASRISAPRNPAVAANAAHRRDIHPPPSPAWFWRHRP